ncbi:ABC transporter permease [Paracoccus laeviglucosivorans]|uniref:Peptide/nickel transport system permease protein n=1 Tax=Paracoccus laeviglucosivorans TaxID=1197861 RepID=A0A521ANC3_9RHOB|nr:ABC transporter permease [Paracoccus laeviglucosivorans]SMO36295.1 peptide/nickel transport system permease protein [Paracoccus laeviglucosivorans]
MGQRIVERGGLGAGTLIGRLALLLVISGVIFLLIEAAPGDPLGQVPLTLSPEVRDRMRAALGMDQPWHLRYLLWLKQLFWIEPLHWLGIDAGQRLISYQSRAPVFDVIAERLPQTLWVVGGGYLAGAALALPMGLIAGWRPGGWLDRACTGLAMLGWSLPTFLTGVLLVLIFGVWLGWLPSVYDTTLRVQGWEGLAQQARQMVMPVAVLALYNAGQLSRVLRAAMVQAAAQDYIRTARAKGMPTRVVLWHMLRNALLPVVTVVALGLPGVFGGAIITEQVFRVNGLGQLLIGAVQANDLPMVLTLTFLFGALIVLCNLVADALYRWLDPRLG